MSSIRYRSYVNILDLSRSTVGAPLHDQEGYICSRTVLQVPMAHAYRHSAASAVPSGRRSLSICVRAHLHVLRAELARQPVRPLHSRGMLSGIWRQGQSEEDKLRDCEEQELIPHSERVSLYIANCNLSMSSILLTCSNSTIAIYNTMCCAVFAAFVFRAFINAKHVTKLLEHRLPMCLGCLKA